MEGLGLALQWNSMAITLHSPEMPTQGPADYALDTHRANFRAEDDGHTRAYANPPATWNSRAAAGKLCSKDKNWTKHYVAFLRRCIPDNAQSYIEAASDFGDPKNLSCVWRRIRGKQ